MFSIDIGAVCVGKVFDYNGSHIEILCFAASYGCEIDTVNHTLTLSVDDLYSPEKFISVVHNSICDERQAPVESREMVTGEQPENFGDILARVRDAYLKACADGETACE